MPTADSHDAQLNSWRQTGVNAKASTKDRLAAQKSWLEERKESQADVLSYYQDSRDTQKGIWVDFLKKYQIPHKDSSYVTTSTVVDGTTVWTDARIHDIFNNGWANRPSEIPDGGLFDWSFASLVRNVNSYVNPIRAKVMTLTQNADDAQELLDVYSQALEQINYTGDPLKTSIFAQVVKGNGKGLVAAIDDSNQAFVYNASGVVDAYFRGGETFEYELKKKKYTVMGSNVPKKVGSAKELWATSHGHKGMISSIDYTKIFRGMDDKGKYTSTNPIVPSSTKTNKDGTTDRTYTNLDITFDLAAKKKYAFQFLYNPGSVDMTFMGTPDVDVGYEISGSDQFGLIGGLGISQSTITFDLVINRMFDMKYYDSTTEHLQQPFKTHPATVYPGKTPTTAEQQLIYRRGTMYDVDYLLRTLLGYSASTTLRFDANGGGTADIGYLGAMPVELHLGQNLRYLGIVNGLSVRHVVFNERMVPLFSTLHVQFNRIPDFPSK